MQSNIHIVAAGNTLAPALAELVRLGFSVSRLSASERGEPFLRAARAGVILEAPDTVALLGLAVLAERRGAKWEPNDAEVAALLSLEVTS